MVLTSTFFAMGPAVDGSAIAGLADFGKDAVEDVVEDVAGRTDIMRTSERVRHILGGGDPRTREISRFVQAGSKDHVYTLVDDPGSNHGVQYSQWCGLLGIAAIVGAGFWFSNPMKYPKRYYPDAPPPGESFRSVVTPGAQLKQLELENLPAPILPDIASVLTKEPKDMTREDLIVLVRGFRDSVYDSADWHKIQELLITALSDASVDNQLATLQEMGIIIAQQTNKTNYICYSYVNLLNRYIDNIRDKRKAGTDFVINPQTKSYLMALLEYWLAVVFPQGSTSKLMCLAMLPRLREI